MKDTHTWQVHASANQDGADLGLRVTITAYDEAGYEIGTHTWRKHVRGLQFDSLTVQAAAIALELYKLMDHHVNYDEVPLEVDDRLF